MFYVLIQVCVVLLLCAQAAAQPGLLPSMRRTVYRVVPLDSGADVMKEATALAFKHQPSGFQFLLLNRHSVYTDSTFTNLCDSMRLYFNRLTDEAEVISGDRYMTISLKPDTSLFFPKSDMDLVIVLISQKYSTGTRTDTVSTIDYSTFINFERLKTVLDRSVVLTAIGYPGKALSPHRARSPEYRWGFYKKHDSSAVWSDIPVVHGSSGSVIMSRSDSGHYHIVGILRGVRDLTQAVPISRVPVDFAHVFKKAVRARELAEDKQKSKK